MRELRTEESEKFENFFRIVREEASKESCIFFVDCGEGRELFTESLEGEDLSGWLIPEKYANEFETEWKEKNVSNKWDDCMRMAIWNNTDNDITICFEEF